MHAIRQTVQHWIQRVKQEIDPFSLQFRLTAGVTLVALLGVGGVATWTAWKTQRILINSHKEWIADVATRIPQDIALYSEMSPFPEAVEKVVEVRSLPGLHLAVRDMQGNLLAYTELMAENSQSQTPLSQTPLLLFSPDVFADQQTELYHSSGQQFVLYSSPLSLGDTTVGYLYIAQDITRDREMFVSVLRSIGLATLLACMLLPVAIALYVRRSLRPLCAIGQLNERIAAQDLGHIHLPMEQAPTEIAHLAQSYEGMLMRLSASWNQQRQFVSDISHELRTPLTIVSGYLSSILRRSETLTEPQREALTIASTEAKRTIQILEDMLELARIDSGHAWFEVEDVSLNDLVHEVASMAEGSSQRAIFTEVTNDVIIARADRDRLKRVLLNLIDNAFKYSAADAPVWLRLEKTINHAQIHVKDRGCGIPFQHQARIFDRFYRVDETRTRATGGCGLGLALVRTFTEGMGGTVSVQSLPDEGTTFTVTLPTADIADPPQ
jgi:signal transduction histidine kinase